eukprot:1161948-Pelagomonas_calceolata.AAC.10
MQHADALAGTCIDLAITQGVKSNNGGGPVCCLRTQIPLHPFSPQEEPSRGPLWTLGMVATSVSGVFVCGLCATMSASGGYAEADSVS